MFQVIKVKKKRSINMAQAHNSTFLSWQEFFPWLYMPYLHEAACLWKFCEQFKMRQCKVCNYQSWQKEDNMTAVFVYHRKTNRKYQNTPGVDLGGVGWVGWSAGPPYLTPHPPIPTPEIKLLNLLNSHDIITKNKVLTSYNPKIRLWFHGKQVIAQPTSTPGNSLDPHMQGSWPI